MALTDQQVTELYEAMRDARHLLEQADRTAANLGCEVLRVQYQERKAGLEVGMRMLAKTTGLRVCPNCSREKYLMDFTPDNFPDSKARKGYACAYCDEGPVEWVQGE